MKPTQALKNRIREEIKPKEIEGQPSLLHVLRKRNQEAETRDGRIALLRRIGRR